MQACIFWRRQSGQTSSVSKKKKIYRQNRKKNAGKLRWMGCTNLFHIRFCILLSAQYFCLLFSLINQSNYVHSHFHMLLLLYPFIKSFTLFSQTAVTPPGKKVSLVTYQWQTILKINSLFLVHYALWMLKTRKVIYFHTYFYKKTDSISSKNATADPLPLGVGGAQCGGRVGGGRRAAGGGGRGEGPENPEWVFSVFAFWCWWSLR